MKMETPDYTIVVGVDAKHLRQLSWVWRTWALNKPSLLQHPILIFRDKYQVPTDRDVTRALEPYLPVSLQIVTWPFSNQDDYFLESDGNKWTDSQRYKMLAGFVHVPAMQCRTDYWLKIDTDTIASGMDDWIDPDWFRGNPAIVSHPWGFTKPADQMLKLDQWVRKHPVELHWWYNKPPLDLLPKEGSSRVSHKRIISWCAFFHTGFTRNCSWLASELCGGYRLPVPSQDGYLWYMAKRGMNGIVRANMKKRGWVHRSSENGIREAVQKALQS